MPSSSRLLGAAVVFFLFASIGFISLQTGTGEQGPWSILIAVLISGGFAVGYAVFGILRKFQYFALCGLSHFLAEYFWHRFQGRPASLVGRPEALQNQLSLLGIGAILSIVVGYLLLIVFVRRLGKSYFRIQTEMALAGEIHRSLVPAMQKRIGNFEIYGVSQPSGEVGGDLVDIAENQRGWTGYIADVSGHGVSSRVLMAMFKTAIRTHLLQGDSPGQALSEVHRVLSPLKPPQMFVTVAVLQSMAANQIQFASAGHPPILHYHRTTRCVSEYPPLGAPLGLLDGQNFSQCAIEYALGDVLLTLTDGLTEVFDRHGKELGLDPLKAAFARDAEFPLPELCAKLRAIAQNFGAQTDDQTMLAARNVA